MNCVPWTDEQWLQRSQPADPKSVYRLISTRYNDQGQPARTYLENDGWAYGVLPGTGNREMFDPGTATEYGTNAEAAALAHIERNGYTLQSPVEQQSVSA